MYITSQPGMTPPHQSTPPQASCRQLNNSEVIWHAQLIQSWPQPQFFFFYLHVPMASPQAFHKLTPHNLQPIRAANPHAPKRRLRLRLLTLCGTIRGQVFQTTWPSGLCTQKGQMQFQTPLFFTCNTHLLNKSITSERFLMPIFPYSFPHSFLPLLLALHLFIFSLRGKYIAKDLETCKINMCFFSQKFFYEIMSLMILCQKVFHICVKSFIYVLQRFLWLKVNFQQKSTGLGTLVLQSLTGFKLL